MITASAVERTLQCAASAVLPHAEHDDRYADEGQGNHADVESDIAKGDLSRLPEELRSMLDGLTVRAEVAIAYDVSTGEARELGVGLNRDYGKLGPSEIAGTADIVAVGGGRLVVADGKLYQEVTHPSRNPQLLTLAVGFSRLLGIPEATLVVFHLDGSDRVRSATVDVFDLGAHESALHEMHLTVMRAKGNPAPYIGEGKHCRHCPAFAACPAKQHLVTSIRTGAADNQVELLLPLGNDEVAADAYEFAQRVRQLLKRLDAAIFARAADKPIPLRNGMMLGKVRTLGNRELDGTKAHALLAEKYGRDAADSAVEMSATQKRIKEVIATKVAKGAASSAMEKFLAELEAASGVSRKPGERIEEFPAKQLKEAG